MQSSSWLLQPHRVQRRFLGGGWVSVRANIWSLVQYVKGLWFELTWSLDGLWLFRNEQPATWNTHIRTHVHTDIHAHTRTQRHTHAHTQTHIGTHTHTHTHTCTHTPARTPAHTHTHRDTHMHAHPHTRTHTRTHLHTHAPPQSTQGGKLGTKSSFSAERSSPAGHAPLCSPSLCPPLCLHTPHLPLRVLSLASWGLQKI